MHLWYKKNWIFRGAQAVRSSESRMNEVEAQHRNEYKACGAI